MADPKDPNFNLEDQGTDVDQPTTGKKGGTAQDDTTDIEKDTDVTEFPEAGSTDDNSEPTTRADE